MGDYLIFIVENMSLHHQHYSGCPSSSLSEDNGYFLTSIQLCLFRVVWLLQKSKILVNIYLVKYLAICARKIIDNLMYRDGLPGKNPPNSGSQYTCKYWTSSHVLRKKVTSRNEFSLSPISIQSYIGQWDHQNC